MTADIFEILSNSRKLIDAHLQPCKANWDSLANRFRKMKNPKPPDFADEQIWTFLLGAGYAAAGADGVSKLSTLLTGGERPVPQPDEKSQPRIWTEPLPIPPREREGNTNLDMAVGFIRNREATEGGIELLPGNDSWVCFCEMKWYSDLSHGVTHDPRRNQLARVIENALSFQTNGTFAKRVFVSLVTPKLFDPDDSISSRFYQYKFRDYQDKSVIKMDLDASDVLLPKRNATKDWIYPGNITERLEALSVRWVSFESLFEQMPDSPLKESIQDFHRKCNET